MPALVQANSLLEEPFLWLPVNGRMLLTVLSAIPVSPVHHS
jgi:hypothetical protein